MRAVFVALVAMTVVVFLCRTAHAQDASPNDVADFVGTAPNGLPGLGRVGVASPREPNFTGALSAGYGFTEAQPDSNSAEQGSHHRLAGTMAAAIQPLRFLSAALMFDGRWEKHPDDQLGSISSSVGEPRLAARLANSLGKNFAAGGQLTLLVPGAEAPSVRFDASRLDAVLMGTFTPAPTFAIAFNGGYRLDRTSNTIDDPRRLRNGDRISLQVSDFDAILLGLGASKRIDRLEVLGEVTWDLLVGSNAPSAIESPLRAGVGARYHFTGGALPGDLQLDVRPEILLGQQPTVGALLPLAPVEPRFAITAGLRWVLPFAEPKKKDNQPDTTQKPTPVAPVVAAGAPVRGRVTAEGGSAAPIANAQITITIVATDSSIAPAERTVVSKADGSFEVADVPAGKAHVVAKADGYDEAAMDVVVGANHEPVTANLSMKKTIRAGQLRGLVRSFNGKPLAATVRVEPINVEVKTDADGEFKIPVPPGSYEVVIQAPGHAGQRRPVQVEENGVTVLNADLRAGP